MKLAMFSHKACWPDATSPSGWATDGGFPFQLRALSELFSETTLVATASRGPRPPALHRLEGVNLQVLAPPEPPSRGWGRKLLLPFWLLRRGPLLVRTVARAEAVHAAVPGDVGTLGLVLALGLRKRLLVRHCGTWGTRRTLAERFLAWLLPRIAGGRNVVLATGAGAHPPAQGVHWVFSTTLDRAGWESAPQATPWRTGDALRLASVGRLTREKNARSAVLALPRLLERLPDTTLTVVGSGPERSALERLVGELDLEERVSLLGHLSHEEVLRLLGRSHLLVFPTQVPEGFPKVVAEALACGLPVLATPVSAIPHLLAGGAGRLLPDPSPDSIAESILALTDQPEAFVDMARTARESSRGLTLEGWQTAILDRIEKAWGPIRARA